MILNTANDAGSLGRPTHGAGSPSCSPPPWRTRHPTTSSPASRGRRPFTVRRGYFLVYLPSNFHTFELSYLQSSTASSRALREGENLPNEFPITNDIAVNLRLTFQGVGLRALGRLRFCLKVFLVGFHIVVAMVSR